MDQDTKGQKEQLRERGETPTAELKAKIEVDLDKQWVWVGIGDRRGYVGWTIWIQKETRERKLEIWKVKGLGWMHKGRKDLGFELGTNEWRTKRGTNEWR